MKKILIFFAALAVAAAATVIIVNNNDFVSTLLDENIEALADTESGGAIIICDSGICGRCFEEITAWPVYKCNWTGMQADYCDCNKLGYL